MTSDGLYYVSNLREANCFDLREIEEEEIILYCNKQLYIIGREARRPWPEAIRN